MEVTATHVYADKGVETVFKSFGTQAKLEQKFAALGARNVNIEICKLTKTSIDLVASREVPVNAPALLKKFLGDWNLTTQEEHWKGSAAKGYVGDMKIAIKGVPITITGRLVLTGDAKNCVNEVTMKFDCAIPLVGRKLAEFVGNTAAGEMRKEYEFIKANI